MIPGRRDCSISSVSEPSFESDENQVASGSTGDYQGLENYLRRIYSAQNAIRAMKLVCRDSPSPNPIPTMG
jgi:hypothetical protein